MLPQQQSPRENVKVFFSEPLCSQSLCISAECSPALNLSTGKEKEKKVADGVTLEMWLCYASAATGSLARQALYASSDVTLKQAVYAIKKYVITKLNPTLERERFRKAINPKLLPVSCYM
ncbi:hypothetical protein GN956_G10419 [Arapaima gigas]